MKGQYIEIPKAVTETKMLTVHFANFYEDNSCCMFLSRYMKIVYIYLYFDEVQKLSYFYNDNADFFAILSRQLSGFKVLKNNIPLKTIKEEKVSKTNLRTLEWKLN